MYTTNEVMSEYTTSDEGDEEDDSSTVYCYMQVQWFHVLVFQYRSWTALHHETVMSYAHLM